jgi:hypothetical protein
VGGVLLGVGRVNGDEGERKWLVGFIYIYKIEKYSDEILAIALNGAGCGLPRGQMLDAM